MKYKLLIVDDDPIELAQSKIILEEEGCFDVDSAEDGADAIEKVKKSSADYALVLLDYQMPGKDGLETAKELLALNRRFYILMHSKNTDREVIRSSFRLGAVDFLDKGKNVEEFVSTIRAWCEKYRNNRQILSTDRSLSNIEKLLASINLAGKSKAMHAVFEKVAKYRNTIESVLILGETGTGKEAVARALHKGPDNLFVSINCGKYSENSHLLEAELFGYEKGAFTGADKSEPGLFEKMEGGTIFVDEAHLLSDSAQGKLLRAFGNKKGMRLKGSKEYDIKCKLVFATKPNFEQMMKNGEIKEDFFYRLDKRKIEIPALRERIDDMECLIAWITKRYYEKYPSATTRTFLMRTVETLKQYRWPGNVRELENLVETLLEDVNEPEITPDHLPQKFFDKTQLRADPGAIKTYSEIKKELEEEERSRVLAILRQSENRTQAAKMMGVAMSTLHGILKRLGVNFPEAQEIRGEARSD